MTSGKAPFRHRPKRKIPMWHRPSSVPPGWCIVDFGGPERRGHEPEPYSTGRMELLRLILDAGDIPYIIKGHGSRMRAWVPAIYELRARIELADVAAEAPPPKPVRLPLRRNGHWAMLLLLILLAWHGLRTGWWSTPFDAADPRSWIQAGSLDSSAVLRGEWWRLATALTLHRDSLHLFSNVVFTSPFLILLAQRTGLGTALAATLASGMLANALNVLYRGPGWNSIGFSTAMFAIVGLLCADMLVRSRASGILRRAAVPAAAAAAFLALLGTEGENIDYAAHIFGLACGFLTGLAVGATMRHTSPERPLQEFLLGAAAAACVACCWLLAL
ncbi:MAG: rhomboid family intramembrane serine protease [Mailhella sp.]|nr:rhomboid family intramembrane serine protease [Mailhella sp.]